MSLTDSPQELIARMSESIVEGFTRMEAFTFALSTQVDLPVYIKMYMAKLPRYCDVANNP